MKRMTIGGKVYERAKCPSCEHVCWVWERDGLCDPCGGRTIKLLDALSDQARAERARAANASTSPYDYSI